MKTCGNGIILHCKVLYFKTIKIDPTHQCLILNYLNHLAITLTLDQAHKHWFLYDMRQESYEVNNYVIIISMNSVLVSFFFSSLAPGEVIKEIV